MFAKREYSNSLPVWTHSKVLSVEASGVAVRPAQLYSTGQCEGCVAEKGDSACAAPCGGAAKLESCRLGGPVYSSINIYSFYPIEDSTEHQLRRESWNCHQNI